MRPARKITTAPRVEADECKDFREWLKVMGYTFTEAPRRGAYFRSSGYAAGRFDFEITAWRDKPIQVAIEMKRADGGEVRSSQVNPVNGQLWAYRQRGGLAAICYGADDAIYTLTAWATYGWAKA